MELKEFFEQHPKIALAFSGGVDSAYLLYAASTSGADVGVYYVKSQFQPEFEFSDAKKLAAQLGMKMTVIEKDILAYPDVAANPADRCYYCKQQIMGGIIERAARDGYRELMDGTNASDASDDRPGMRVLQELKIYSPLRICGLTKAQIRRLSKEAGLPTWNKPAYACLATRVRTGETITDEKLEKIEKSEDILFGLGFTDFRVRMRGGSALLQFTAEQSEKAADSFKVIDKELGQYFDRVEIDAAAREKSV